MDKPTIVVRVFTHLLNTFNRPLASEDREEPNNSHIPEPGTQQDMWDSYKPRNKASSTD